MIFDASCGNGAFSPRIEIVRSAGGRCATVFGRVLSSISFPLSSYSVREIKGLRVLIFVLQKIRIVGLESSCSAAWKCSGTVLKMLGDVDQHKKQYSAVVNSKKNCGACRSLWLASRAHGRQP